MKRSNLTIAFYVLCVFAGGVAVGGFGHRLYTVKTVSATSNRKTPDDYRRAYMSEMKQRLQLTATQSADIEKILDSTRQRYQQFRERTKPEMEKIQSDQTEGIRSLLNPVQSAEYEKMRSEREAKRKREHGGGGL